MNDESASRHRTSLYPYMNERQPEAERGSCRTGCAFEVAFMRPSWTVMDINFFVPSTKETETRSASHLLTNHAAEDCASRFPVLRLLLYFGKLTSVFYCYSFSHSISPVLMQRLHIKVKPLHQTQKKCWKLGHYQVEDPKTMEIGVVFYAGSLPKCHSVCKFHHNF